MRKTLTVIGAIAAALALAVVGVLIFASTRPDVIHVERSVTVDAAAQDVFPLINDHTEFMKWSPWADIDPEQISEFSDPPSGVGAWYAWSGNKQVGSGKMTITASEPDTRVVQDLEFFEPFESKAEVALIVEPAGDQVEVTWTYDEDAALMSKTMGLFMDMDTMLGGDFDKGLGRLATMAEAAAADRIAAERIAAEKVAADATEGSASEPLAATR